MKQSSQGQKFCFWMLSLNVLLVCPAHLSSKPRNIHLRLGFWSSVPPDGFICPSVGLLKASAAYPDFLLQGSLSSGLIFLALSILGSERPHSSTQWWLYLSCSWFYKSVEIQSQILQETKNHNAHILPRQAMHPKETDIIFNWKSLMCLCSFVCFVSFPWFNESKIHFFFFFFPNEPLSLLGQNVKKKKKNALFQVIRFHSERKPEKRNHPFSCPLVETFVRYDRYFFCLSKQNIVVPPYLQFQLLLVTWSTKY